MAYLRADTKKRKKGGLVDREEVSLRQQENQKIYEEASEYVKRAADDERKGRRDRDKLSDKPKSYFDAKDRGGRDGDDRDRFCVFFLSQEIVGLKLLRSVSVSL